MELMMKKLLIAHIVKNGFAFNKKMSKAIKKPEIYCSHAVPKLHYKDFVITESQYIEEPHPQYNYLGFMANNSSGQHYEVIFNDLDMRIKTHNELLNIFIEGLDKFIKKN